MLDIFETLTKPPTWEKLKKFVNAISVFVYRMKDNKIGKNQSEKENDN